MSIRTLSLGFVFVWFFGGGIGHFVPATAAFFRSIVPDYLPHAAELVRISGAFELLGAVGLLLPATRRWAGLGLFALTLAVTPANLWMLQHPERYPAFPYAALVVRMFIQVLLLWCIWHGTQPRAAKELSLA